MPQIKPSVNVYLENSGSMDGYVNGGTEFASVLYRYLKKLDGSGFHNAINLHYINSDVIPLGNNLTLFDNKNLTPKSFREAGGYRGGTDISDLFEKVLANTNDTTVSILISDFIFSPGKGISADKYLEDQKTTIMSIFERQLKTNDLSVIIYQFYSHFKGIYYNVTDQKTVIDNSRPFYMCVLGRSDYLKQFLMQNVLNDPLLSKKLSNEFSISNTQNVKYSVAMGSGLFKLDKKNPQTNIVNAKKDKKRGDLLTCNINVDFSGFLLNDNYLTNIDNYTVNDRDFKVAEIHSTNTSGFTHRLRWQTPVLKPTTLSIKLMKKVPEWVETSTDSIGVDINAAGAMEKTYGLKYLISGIYEAFVREKDYYTKMDININK